MSNPSIKKGSNYQLATQLHSQSIRQSNNQLISTFKCHLFVLQEEPQRKLLIKWTLEEVCSWLESIGLKQYEESFRNNAIDGAELFNLTMEILVDDLKIGKASMYKNIIFNSKKSQII